LNERSKGRGKKRLEAWNLREEGKVEERPREKEKSLFETQDETRGKKRFGIRKTEMQKYLGAE